MTKTTKTVAKKTVAKAAEKVAVSKKPVKRGCGSRPGEARKKVDSKLAKAIRKVIAKAVAKEGKFNIAAVAREFSLSTVTVMNVHTEKYAY